MLRVGQPLLGQPSLSTSVSLSQPSLSLSFARISTIHSNLTISPFRFSSSSTLTKHFLKLCQQNEENLKICKRHVPSVQLSFIFPGKMLRASQPGASARPSGFPSFVFIIIRSFAFIIIRSSEEMCFDFFKKMGGSVLCCAVLRKNLTAKQTQMVGLC